LPFINDVRKYFILFAQKIRNTMTECYFSQPEDVEGRKNLKDLQYHDVFPQTNPYYKETDEYFPENVNQFVYQLRSQEHLRKSAQLMNQYMGEMNLKDQQYGMTDDQRRVQKIKERMMLKKLSKVQSK
jgi:hypothetical protein